MGRKPNPKAKTNRITLCGKPTQEVEIRAMKEICARDGLDISDELYHYGVKAFLRAHNWPPGNSQAVLSVYGAKPKYVCSRCGGKFPKLQRVQFVSGLTAELCPDCLEHETARNVVKKRMGLIQ